MRNKVITTAKSYLGLKEADGSHKIIIDLYNSIKPLPQGYRLSYSEPWCAAFVSAVGWECGLSSIIFPEISCDRMIELYKRAGRWIENDAFVPQMGDLIFYDWQDTGGGDNIGSSDHVGFVAAVSGSTMTIIEGNMSDKVGERLIAVNARYIRGFGVPNYEGMPLPDKPDVIAYDSQKPAKTKKAFIAPRVLQGWLVDNGYSVGKDGVDGKIGKNTATGLEKALADIKSNI